MGRISFIASEEKLFENVDQWMDNGHMPILPGKGSPVSLNSSGELNIHVQ